MSNIKQSEELGYIFERKNQQKNLGNALEKPHIHIKRFQLDCMGGQLYYLYRHNLNIKILQFICTETQEEN
ncbi:unnamed protein product [Paramecium octaurelia]|uniref:Uncharacterized protein n=1 Tax=Paramecium octaurelia TaxID=43137 RepID=A0A8S1W8Q7_PAROT|nr:unnamed protein product [Paramecium octaurelia]